MNMNTNPNTNHLKTKTMTHLFKKGIFILFGLSLIIACSSDDDPVATTPSVSITNLSFTAVASGDGTVVTVTPSSTGGTSYSVDFGSSASDDVIPTAGPAVSYDYPNESATYTIVVTASATGADNVTKSEEFTVTFVAPDPSDLEGTWVLFHDAGALKVGPTAGSGEWWQNQLADVITRDCLFDDQYIFNADGSFSNVLGDATWLEPALNGVAAEECGAAQAPFDGSAEATWVHDKDANTVALNGKGAFLGLPKIYNLGELDNVANAKESILYNIESISEDGNTLVLQIQFQDGGGWWTFTLAKEGSAGASLPTTDTDGDGVLDYNDTCPTVAGNGTDGCPVVAAPTTAPTAPSISEASVVSIYSDAYTDLEATFNPDWGQGGSMVIEEIAGNNVRKYSNLTFSGIDLGADVNNRIEIASVSTVTFDYWTSNATAVGLKLVDYGTDGVWEQATNLEGAISREPTTGSWVTVTVGISEFANISADGKIGQLVLTMDGDGTQIVYIDNIYFY